MKRRNSLSWKLSGLLCSLALALAAGCAAAPGDEPGLDTQVPPTDTAPVDLKDTADLEDNTVAPPDTFDPPFILAFPPTTCGKPGTTTFGWYANEFAEIRVKAEHAVAGYTGSNGISKVKLYQITKGDGKLLDETSKVNAAGFFVLDFEAERALLDEDEDGNYIDGLYNFRVEATSKVTDNDGKLMTAAISFAMYIDFTGPVMQIIQPAGTADDPAKLSAKATLLFTSSDPGSGNGSFSVSLGSQATDTVIPVPDPTSSGPFFGNLDLTPFETTDTDLLITATDCLGNQSSTGVPVRVIAVPRFVLPPSTPLKKPGVGVGMRTLHATNGDGDGVLGNLDLVGASGTGVLVWWWNPATKTFSRGEVVSNTRDSVEALFHDFSGDGVPDLVVLANNGDKKKYAVELWRQNNGEDLLGTRKFTLVGSIDVSDSASAMVLGDFNGDKLKDVAVVSQSELETLNLLMHTKAKDGDEGTLVFLGKPTVFTGASQAVSAATADFNQDGYLDIALGRKGFQMVTVFTNNGKGEFPMGLDSMMVGLGSELIKVTDLDLNDSAPDLLVFNADLEAFMGFQGRGDGYFSSPTPGLGVKAQTFAQIHGVAVNPEEGISEPGLLFGDLPIGDLVFLAAPPFDMELGDLNRDGFADFVVSLQGRKTIALFWGVDNAYGTGMFQQTFFLNGGASPGPLALGDFDRDTAGDLDLVVANTDTGELLLFMNDHKGGFIGTRELPMPIKADGTDRLEPTHMLLGDLDDDGDQDIAVVTAQDKLFFDMPNVLGEMETVEKSVAMILTWLEVADRPPQYNVRRTSASPKFANVISGAAIGRLDGDSYPDLVLVSKTIPPTSDTDRTGNFDILRGGFRATMGVSGIADVQYPSVGRFWPLGGLKGPMNPVDVAIAPLDTLPPDDLVMIAPQTGNAEKPDTFQGNLVRAYLTKYDRFWNPCSSNYFQTYFACCGPQDADEPCTTGFSGCPNNYSCQGITSPGSAVGLDPTRIVAEDIDGDEIPDLIVVNQGSNNVTYLRGEANPNYYDMNSPAKPWGLFAVGSDPKDVDVGDIDGDGWKDLVVALASKISVSYGSEGVNFETPVYLTKDELSNDMAPTGILMADVNDDGYIDIVASSGNRGRIWVYVSGGARDFLGPYGFECGVDPVDVVVAHLRDSECTDLAVLNKGSGTVTLLENARCRSL
jgi:hypothetical protein